MQTQLLLLAAGSLVAWLLWTAYYRLFLHPLAKIPGPILPRLSTLYEMYFDLWLPAQYPFQLKKLHEQYGPILRPVPNEVHISDPDFLDVIYATRNRNQQTQFGLDVEQSIAGAEEFSLHKMRRDALSPCFSLKTVVSMEDLFMEKTNKVVAHFGEALKTGQPLNLSDVYFAFSNDLTRGFSFGNDNGLLDDLAEANIQRVNLMRLLRGVKLNKHMPWIPKTMGTVLPAVLGDQALPPAVMDLIRFKARAKADIEAVFADKNNDKKGRNSIFYELRDSPILPPEEKLVPRLQDEATIIVMAGTESLAKSLQYGSFFLNYYPNTFEKLRAELREARAKTPDGALSLSNLLALPYMNAVINETNRLTFGVTHRMARYSPNETLTYTASYGPHKGTTYVLPPRTYMSCITYCTHTNEELFPDPFTFDPDRFMGQSEEVSRRKRCMMALGKGHRKCLGINVANAGMCLVFAKLAELDMELTADTTYDDVAFLYDYQISHPRLDTKGIQVRMTGRK